jgi:hypothetical protein
MTEVLDRTIGAGSPEDDGFNDATMPDEAFAVEPTAITEPAVPRIDTLAEKTRFPSLYGGSSVMLEGGTVKPLAMLDRYVDSSYLADQAGADSAVPLDHASASAHRADVAAFIVGFATDTHDF